MTGRTLVTGFLPFGGFSVNPSALLAESCGRTFELLEVSYAAVDAFLSSLAARAGSFDRLLMLGLRGNGTFINLERLARNHIGPSPDVRDVVRGPAPIEAGAPATLATTLFDPGIDLPVLRPSDDAGSYLCNYIYYRALRSFPTKAVGFVHVPPLDVVPLETQRRELADLLERLEHPPRAPGAA